MTASAGTADVPPDPSDQLAPSDPSDQFGPSDQLGPSGPSDRLGPLRPERVPDLPGDLSEDLSLGLSLGLSPDLSPGLPAASRGPSRAVPPALPPGFPPAGDARRGGGEGARTAWEAGIGRDAGDTGPTADGRRRVVRRTGFTIAADGSYAACLALAHPSDDAWFAERWTLAGPESYAVPLPAAQPEEEGTRVLPLSDGRVLVTRRVADRYDLVLLHPSGSDTAEVPVGSLPGPEVRMLPPSPARSAAFALGYEGPGAAGGGVGPGGGAPGGAETGAGVRTVVWRVHGTAAGVPERVMTVDGRCTGGVWLDRSGRLLALDRALDGRTKAVAVDLHAGTVSPLLQLTEDSDDRLLLAEPDSGLLVLRSDAAGEARLGWGVLGSRRPVRFPDTLCVRGTQLAPVAAQPGQILSPESTVVALRAEVPGGAESLGLWRPGERRVHWRASPPGWLGAAGVWLPGGDLRLPYADPVARECGMLAYDVPPQPLPVPAALPAAPPRLQLPRRAERVVKEPRGLPPARRTPAVLPLQQALLPA